MRVPPEGQVVHVQQVFVVVNKFNLQNDFDNNGITIRACQDPNHVSKRLKIRKSLPPSIVPSRPGIRFP
jgi:hypothetical protein